jgi:RNA methyltransferase
MKKPNFSHLAAKYPELWANITEKNSSTTEGILRLNWNDEKTQRILTEITLKDAFGININLPSNRLCPPVPNRLSYISWLSELIGLSFPPLCQDLVDVVRSSLNKVDESRELTKILDGDKLNNYVPAHDFIVVLTNDAVATGLRSETVTVDSDLNEETIGVVSSCSDVNRILEHPAKDGRFHDEETIKQPRHHILDIGVGASCIYPLLGHQQHKWR